MSGSTKISPQCTVSYKGIIAQEQTHPELKLGNTGRLSGEKTDHTTMLNSSNVPIFYSYLLIVRGKLQTDPVMG